ncbi:MAG: hypothetical protein IT350_00170, partial [Deltaproteobacteria bacterium]|nr:hypothetical protein [Deltaproteobacteria bacterium]
MRVESMTANPREVFAGRSPLADRARMVCAAAVIIVWSVFGPPAICVASSSYEATSAATLIAKKSDIVGKLVLLEHTVHFRQLERYFYDVTDKYIYYNSSNKAIQAPIELPLASCGYWDFPYDGDPLDIRKMIANHEVIVNGMPVRPVYQASKSFNTFQYNRYVFSTKIAPRAKTFVERKYRLRVSVMRPDEYFLEFWAGVPLGEISKKFKLIFEFTDSIP